MTDLTLDDLASPDGTDTEPEAQDSGTDDDSGGEWIGKLIDRLDERGMLDAIIAQQFDLDTSAMNDANIDPDDDSTDAETDAAELDAADVAQFGKLVIDNVGDVPMSQVVQYAEGNPKVVNQLIQEATGQE